jgi:transcriptional regulator with XRE-family HTH domain
MSSQFVSGVAERVKAKRIERNLTRNALAAKASLGRAVVSRLERGKREPRHETLKKLADALGVTVSWLITGPEPPSAS